MPNSLLCRNLSLPFQYKHVCVYILVLIVVCVLYANSFSAVFLGDDRTLILQNSTVRSISINNLQKIFCSYFFDATTEYGRIVDHGAYYRPLSVLSFVVDYAFWKEHPAGYHILNILLFFLSCVFFYRIVYLLSNHYLLSASFVLLFASHPLHTRYVTPIYSRTDLLCVFFYTGACWFYLHSVLKEKWKAQYTSFIGTILFFACALLSKESAITFPFLVLGIAWIYRNRIVITRKQIVSQTILLFLTLFLYLYVRRSVLHIGLPAYLKTALNADIGLRVISAMHIVLQYLGFLVLPVNIPLHWHYAPITSSYLSIETISAVLLLCCLLGAFIISLRKDKLIAFGLMWTVITYLPVSNLIPLYIDIARYNLFVGVQFFYLPLFGMILVIVRLCFNFVNHFHAWKFIGVLRRSAAWVLIGIVIIFGGITIRENITWSNGIYFYNTFIEQFPNNVDGYNNLAAELLTVDRQEEAIILLKEAIQLWEKQKEEVKGNASQPFINLINVYCKRGEYKKANALCEKTLKYFPQNSLVFHYLGGLSEVAGEYDKAIQYYKKALSLNSTLSLSSGRFLKILRYDKPLVQQLSVYEEKLADHKDNASLYARMGDMYRINYLYTEAISYYKRALYFDPTIAVTRSNLAWCYGVLGLNSERRKQNAVLLEQTHALLR